MRADTVGAFLNELTRPTPAMLWLERAAAERYVPSLVIAGGAPSPAGEIALLADRAMRDGRATAYVCRSYACDAPATSAEVLVRQLERVGV